MVATQSTPDAFRAERVKQVYANEPAGLVGTALGGALYAWLMVPVAGPLRAWSWCLALFLVTAGRLWARDRFRREGAAAGSAGYWARAFRAGVLLSGAAWGSTALFFFPEAGPSHQVFTALMIAGMTAGAAAAYSALEGAFAAFAVPAVAPILAAAAVSDDPLHRTMAAAILAWCLFMLLVSRSIRRSAHRAICLGFENRGLLESLTRTMQETLSLNASLRAEVRERRLAEALLQRHRDELEAEVERRTGELSRANAELREALEARTRMEEERRSLEEQLLLARKMESLGTLAGGVAHDFNNLLMGIGGQIGLLLAGRDGDDPEAARLRAVERQVREGAELTRQLLGLAMGGKYEARPLDPGELVRKVGALFARTHREIRVSVRVEEGLPAVEADRGQLEQALLNICINAWQAMPGGGTLDLTARRARVDGAKAAAFGAAPGEFAVIEAADTGAGMDRSVLARIFDPFFTTREPGRGAGLGLSSAYGIVRNHGGFIEVDSEKGRGSTFAIHLPQAASAAPALPVPASRGGDRRRTVLVVDDEPMVSEVAGLMLQRLGFRVLRAMGGQEALDLYRGWKAGGGDEAVDLVVLDMIMPGMAGDETFRRLREMDPSARVLLSSGYSVEGRAQDLLKEGCLGFLPKPYTLAELRAKLEEVLGEALPARAASSPEGT